jgi:hypothetical protein
LQKTIAETKGNEYTDVLGESLWFATAEDTILIKLEWSKMADSQGQFYDALNFGKTPKGQFGSGLS